MQEMFDAAVKGLASQRFIRSWYNSPTFRGCRYRDPDGRKCAVGWNISDEEYDQGFEGKDVLFVMKKLGYSFSTTEIEFLYRLQNAHDCANRTEYMKCELLNVGRKFGLEIPKELE